MIARLLILGLALGISSGLLLEHADGLLEIKKYKVINSQKVCGDKMCSEVDEERSKKGLSSHNVEICGDRPCHEVEHRQVYFTNESSPYGQFRLGVDLDLIQCKQGQEMVIKKTTHLPACVKMKNAEKLREKGWATSKSEQQEIFREASDNRMKNYKLAAQSNLDVSLSIVFQEISNQRYLMFDGERWHRLHNVEITISGEEFKESVRTKTDDRGHLNMPWPIPDAVGGRVYNIFATDGIHEFAIDIPISPKNTR